MLRQGITWLDTCENNHEQGLIDRSQFLSSNTAKGLRATINSAMDLCRYLHEKFSFAYILTGKLNQDPLEVQTNEVVTA